MASNLEKIGIAINELQQKMDALIEVDAEGNKSVVDWRDIGPIALEDTVKSENLAVGQTIMVHVRIMTLILLLIWAIEAGNQKLVKELSQAFDAIFPPTGPRDQEYIRVVEILPNETHEMALERIKDQKIVEKLVSQARRMALTVENLRRLYEDLSIFAKMFGGFAIDSAKKYGIFVVPYAERTQKGLDVRIKNLDDKFFGVKRAKDDTKFNDKAWGILPAGQNGLKFAVSNIESRDWWVAGQYNEKYMLNDPVSQGMDISLQQAKDLIRFYGEQQIPVFSVAMKDAILTKIASRQTFYIALLAAKYMTELWLTLNSWKQEKIRIVVGRNQGRPCKEEIAAVKSQATPGFKRIKEENIRAISHVFRALTGKEVDPDFVAAVAVAACFTNKSLAWEEEDYTISAMTMATEFVNLFFYRRMKAQENECPEVVVEPLDLLAGIENGQTLDFVDGEAEDHESEEQTVAVAVDDSVQGRWEVFEDEKGRPFIKRSVESLLVEALTTGDESIRVFAAVADNKQAANTLGKVLDVAQAKDMDVTLAYAAYAENNSKVGNAIVVDGEIVGQYRTPYVDKKSYRENEQRFAEAAYQALVSTVGGIRGKVERFYNYYSQEKKTYCTVCVLKDIKKVTNKESLYPSGLTNRMNKDIKGSKEAAQKLVQESLKGIQTVSI